ncbi:bifunctional ADP-dependent NAD(P)H-hydrate dehydratase/NAD(P)H-hydrate epimerase [Leptospira mayottensis]|uniref:Bifunctional NAD(P)H-hydrate repair enzyme n=2 Tax=Leptospira mayottensis TaxID=1137606 RepID=A0AA87SYE6_9LEPT|nr:bifunctional ADP-dependent NAD(P)H-hydrate dehydratase/NAD(P)H-hydrate epimerase [Leptospira mayottensis]AXR61880.1 bifunctional ADP-dependent NAD(P)H-hydrate dehydratase/NAD(P)H-hydrate epimerase [Leptospira mayottensis]AXR65792.1 bifunctional ADP-dependent NAD(P)H-hydrate dehydratase/NAD(P)H-hydrate epimerase [Leptospira mayottensis]AZQ01669.1 bifunctional ADP-dependent (S)-NAD(P)H-hydrate dehydratase/NAD(P)H-hydrate epimerase [Leptospira mayottensis 200901116]EKS01776.1 YjeF family C-term
MEIKFFEYSEPLFNDEESRDLDRKTISSSGISGSHFMGFAALSIYQKYRKKLLSYDLVQILCGNGNNGGDGLALAFFLIQGGIKPKVYLKDGSLSEESKFYKNAFLNSGGKTLPLESFEVFSGKNNIFVVDALLGTGFRFPLKSPLDIVISKIKENKQKNPKGNFILSIDAVSGFNEDFPLPFETDALAEIGIKKWKNRFLPGKVRKTFHRIGFPILSLSIPAIPSDQNQGDPVSRTTFNIEFNQNQIESNRKGKDSSNEDQKAESNKIKDQVPFEPKTQTGKILWKKIPKFILKKTFLREENSHKYKNGSLVLIGGSQGMSGAALSSLLTFHELGGGISLLLTPSEKTVRRVLKKDPSLMVNTIPESSDIMNIPFVQKASVFLLGPGLKTEECPIFPLPKERFCVLDAGAIKAYQNILLHEKVLMTPHTGELENLLNTKIKSIEQGISLAKEYTKNFKTYLLWKRHSSFLIDPNGTVFLWETPEPKLAVMGTGDLLVGILSFYLSRNFTVPEAVQLSFSLLTQAAKKSKGFPTASEIRKLLTKGDN